ncbi:precorrin-2 C(20)-methyltransferase [Geobacter sp. DSM 9736]|uniref:precorrin-2 C(20)-methyltransferase n=1 Tax=Geobacter sp. DSM 9736 TaxID=1277350 RepID=UPI000B5F2D94|nr:precorrin-2 C(20)-methyltransferase [Geobacter sp. DSM 9736]SNB46976.1 precorrin-2 C20-methyltransferase /cobalt-factor II C20-methyltransferase [Geobacter sp. DSM 9736]
MPAITSARIYAVGIGPGDPDLLTRKAERIIRQVPVICCPTGAAEASSYALSIVEQFIDRSRQEVLVQVFPMRMDQEGLDAYWEKAAEEVAARIARGQDVAFITIGDPFLYSTFLYLYRIFIAKYPGIPVEIVPGVTSIGAAAAASGVPLGMGSERIAILPAAYEDEELRRTLKDFDTVVLMKVSRVFDRLYAVLKELGLADRGVFIRRVGSSAEEVVFDLASLVGKELDYLSMVIVRKTVIHAQ